jgi:hypothetical protein
VITTVVRVGEIVDVVELARDDFLQRAALAATSRTRAVAVAGTAADTA